MATQKPLVISSGVTKRLPTGDTIDLGSTVDLNGVTYTWPGTNGANLTVLTEDGSGGLTWTAPTGGPPTGAAGPTYLSGTYPDPAVVGLGQKLFWVVEGGKYATLQAAYNAASEGDTIVVGPKATGTWGDLTLAENKTMSIVGLNGPQGKTVKIGAVTFSPSTPSLNINRNEYFFANVMITGSFASQAVLFSGTGAGRMRFVGCYVDNTSATGDGIVNSNTFNTGASSSLYLDDCVVQVVTTTGAGLRHSGSYTWIKNRTQIEGGLHAIEQTAGFVEIVGASIVMDGAASTVELSGTATMTMGYSTISNSNNAAGAIGVNINSATATFGSGNATISVGSSVLAAGKAVAGTGTVAYTNIAFSYASTIDNTLTQSIALSTAPWFSTRVKQGISLTAPGSGLLEVNASGRLNRYNDAAPTNGQVLIGDTAAGYWKAGTIAGSAPVAVTNGAGTISIGLTGAVSAANGGTGQTSYAVGDLLYASAATTVSKLADVATGNALISGGVGVAPSYGKIGLTTHVSGTLAVGNGGTGITTTPANGQIPIGNGTTYAAATLTAGTGIAVTNGAGSITVAASNAAGVQPITTIAVNTTLGTTNYTVLCNSNTGAITVTLPAAATNSGRVYVIKRTGTNTVTIDPNGAETIDGAATYTLGALYASAMIQCDGTAWYVLANV